MTSNNAGPPPFAHIKRPKPQHQHCLHHARYITLFSFQRFYLCIPSDARCSCPFPFIFRFSFYALPILFSIPLTFFSKHPFPCIVFCFVSVHLSSLFSRALPFAFSFQLSFPYINFVIVHLSLLESVCSTILYPCASGVVEGRRREKKPVTQAEFVFDVVVTGAEQ